MSERYRVGVDIGGTFTDIVLLGADGTLHTKKISSSVGNYAQAIVEGLSELFVETGLAGGVIEEIRHGTTVASNAILEHKGARVGLITTKGFRDVLEIRTLRMPKLYDLAWEKPAPLVERYLRQVVDERVDARGRIERALDVRDAERAVDALLAEKVEAIAVCLLNSFANPRHELMIKEVLERKAPGLKLSVSYEVLPEIKEYERTSTTVINAYVMPIVASYLRALRLGLDGAGIPARLLLMQSNGGLTSDQAAAERPMNIIESGPAGGVVGAQSLARAKALPKIITFDMGGTTAKASMVEDGEVTRAAEYSVGAGIMTGSRLLTGAGYTLKVPAIDLAEVGAGGGSLVWIDGGGSLQIGPESAGALPGPVCYDKGGETPTVTDANVVLGYINPGHLVGGALALNADKARQAFQDKVASPLGLDLEKAAYGAHLIAASNMIRAIKSVSTERGRDPREFALFAFGGNGPLFACGMAKSLGMSRVVVPPSAGLFSSFGLLYADVEHHYSRTFRRLLRQADLTEIGRAWGTLADQARGPTRSRGFRTRGASASAGRPRCTTRARATSSPCRCRMADRRAHGRPARRGLRSGAREDLRSPRRQGRAGRVGLDPDRRPGPSPGFRHSRATEAEPRRAPAAATAPRLFRRRRLDRNPDPAPLGPRGGAAGPDDHRGIRRHLRRAAGRDGEPRFGRQHHDRARLESGSGIHWTARFQRAHKHERAGSARSNELFTTLARSLFVVPPAPDGRSTACGSAARCRCGRARSPVSG